jgi:hypothetical protein
MTTDHRGRPVGGNHRSTPRVQQAIAKQIQRDTNISLYESAGLASNVIRAHRQGSPLSGRGPIETGPVQTGLRPYVGDKEYNEVMDRVGPGAYDHGRDDAWSDTAASINYPHEVNRAVRTEGGTGSYIGKAVKNRQGYAEDDSF